MPELQFDNQKTEYSFSFQSSPIFSIGSFDLTPQENWLERIQPIYILVKMRFFDKDRTELGMYQSPPLVLSNYVSAFDRSPPITINQLIKYPESNWSNEPEKAVKWEVVISLNGGKLEEGEVITIRYIDQVYIMDRLQDYRQRVRDLIVSLKELENEISGLSVRVSQKVTIYEELMQKFEVGSFDVEAADVFMNGKMVMAVKPFALWVLGANGRIDLLTEQGNHVLLDRAEPFEQATWVIYYSSRKQVEFDKGTLLQILGL